MAAGYFLRKKIILPELTSPSFIKYIWELHWIPTYVLQGWKVHFQMVWLNWPIFLHGKLQPQCCLSTLGRLSRTNGWFRSINWWDRSSRTYRLEIIRLVSVGFGKSDLRDSKRFSSVDAGVLEVGPRAFEILVAAHAPTTFYQGSMFWYFRRFSRLFGDFCNFSAIFATFGKNWRFLQTNAIIIFVPT
jgi:hypothetical protein